MLTCKLQVTLLDELQRTIQGAASAVGPAVVGLRRGSGVVTAKDEVFTVAHVLRGDEPTVTFHDGRTATAHVKGVDVDLDVAVLTVDTREIAPVPFGAAPELGAPVLALANPGGHGLRVTFGLVSATGRSFRGPRGRRIGGSIEHTAPLPRGSSGGPLIDRDGNLLGLNAVRRDGGLILAIAADASLRDNLASGRHSERPRLGVALAHPRAARKLRSAVGLPERDGLLVRAVVDDSPAATAGLQQGDLLVGANGRPLTSAEDLFAVLTEDPLTLGVVRGTEEREVVVHFSS
jgi:S1-C subfamily serine protease